MLPMDLCSDFFRFMILFVTGLSIQFFRAAALLYFLKERKFQTGIFKQQRIQILGDGYSFFVREWRAPQEKKNNGTWQMIWSNALRKSLPSKFAMNLKWWTRKIHLPVEILRLLLLFFSPHRRIIIYSWMNDAEFVFLPISDTIAWPRGFLSVNSI